MQSVEGFHVPPSILNLSNKHAQCNMSEETNFKGSDKPDSSGPSVYFSFGDLKFCIPSSKNVVLANVKL